MDLRTAIRNANDPGKYRALNTTLSAALFAVYARKFAKERTLWNTLPLIRSGVAVVEAAFKPGKTTE